MPSAIEILQKYWGFKNFRKGQDQIIDAVFKGKDTLALLPTGGGKSICYQVPGLAKEGVCLVISPLIALMQDQVKQLQNRGIKASAITAGLNKRSIDIELDNAIYGKTKFLYVSPERLKSNLFQVRLQKMNINLIAVDEAHCISEWGYDFRPAYLQIADIRKIKPDTPIIALTATATPEVVEDIQSKLELKDCQLFQNSFERSNLIYNTLESNNKLNRLMEFVSGNTDSGIIYCKTRKGVKNLCKHLIDKGFNADFYHGGLDFKARIEKQQAWIENKTQIIVCTNAFGMGIDKPDVRFVIHYDLPETIEAYFQEAGRAGRDGNNAVGNIFYEPSDIDELTQRIIAKYPHIDDIKKVYNALGNYFQLAIGSGKDESFPIDILDFCDSYKFDIITVYNALKFLEIGENIALSENLVLSSKVKITTDQMSLYQHQVRNDDTNKVVQFLLRTQMGIFDDLVNINENKIQKHTGVPLKKVFEILHHLSQHEAIQYIPNQKGSYITYLTERLTNENVHIPAETYHNRKRISIEKAEAMIDYLKSNECTNVFLLNYFGETNAQNCDKCNKCLEKSGGNINIGIQQVIYNYLNDRFNNESEIMISEVIAEFKNLPKENILQEIRKLVDHKVIQTDSKGQSIKPY